MAVARKEAVETQHKSLRAAGDTWARFVGKRRFGVKRARQEEEEGGRTHMLEKDSLAVLSFLYFHKLCECYTEEATSTAYFCLLLPSLDGQSAQQQLGQGASTRREQQQSLS